MTVRIKTEILRITSKSEIAPVALLTGAQEGLPDVPRDTIQSVILKMLGNGTLECTREGLLRPVNDEALRPPNAGSSLMADYCRLAGIEYVNLDVNRVTSDELVSLPENLL